MLPGLEVYFTCKNDQTSMLEQYFDAKEQQKSTPKSTMYFWLLLIVILMFAAFLRLYALNTYPQRFNQDEMLLGYDAWSIWTTGHDHHGTRFPIFFRSFNDYVPPVANYIAAPFVGLLGLSEESTRLPFALMGIATVFLVALLGRAWFNASAGLLTAFLLTIEPWHINYSRIAYPASCVPFFTVVSLYCFTQAASFIEGRSRLIKLLWLVGSALAFALLTSSYPTMKLEAPLLLLACALALIARMRGRPAMRWADFFLWLAFSMLFVSPLVLAQLQNWNNIQERFDSISVFHVKDWLLIFLFQYGYAYSLSLLFLRGYGGGITVRPLGVGELCWLEAPLFIFAWLGFLRNRHISRQLGFVLSLLMLLWLITFPIASSLTLASPHETRAYNFLPLPELLAGYGGIIAWDMLGRYRWFCLSMAIVVLVAFNYLFLSSFFAPPLLQTDATAKQMPYNIGLRPVLTAVMRQIRPCDTVWLEPGTSFLGNQTYMYFLFLTRYPPNKFQMSKPEQSTQWYDLYTQIGQVHFALPDDSKSKATRESLPGECQAMPSRFFFITRGVPLEPGWQPVFAVRNHAGIPIWQAFVQQ